jgi:FlaA1/EpsC-like NDP-sugar epimerase
MKRQSLFNTLLFVALDCLFCWLSWIGSVFVFTYLFVTEYTMITTANQNIPFMIVACTLFYAVCGVYKRMWQYPGVGIIIRLGLAAFLASFSVYVLFRARLGYWPNPGLGMMAFCFLLTMSAGLRLFKRFWQVLEQYLQRMKMTKKESPQNPVRTLIVGAGESTVTFLLNKSQHGPRQR